MARMTTGPVSQHLPPVGGGHMTTGPVTQQIPWPNTPSSIIDWATAPPPPAGTQVVKVGWGWATITAVNPIKIMPDGTTNTLDASPMFFVNPLSLAVGTRVWVQSYGLRRYIHFVAVGTPLNWRTAPIIKSGLSPRPTDTNDYTPRVTMDPAGWVHFTGQMNYTGMSGLDVNTAIIQIPAGFWPNLDVRWQGFQTDHPSTPFGGWISTSDGMLYFRVESGITRPTPTAHWCINALPWRAQ